jgi:hypothetical protein
VANVPPEALKECQAGAGQPQRGQRLTQSHRPQARALHIFIIMTAEEKCLKLLTETNKPYNVQVTTEQ